MKTKAGIFIKSLEPLCPSLHLALETYYFKQNYDFPIAFLRTNKKSVVIGNNQLARAECNLQAMKNDSITLIKRKSGGGAVYLDDGNCMFGFINKQKFDCAKKDYEKILLKSINNTFGINAEMKGKNDVVVNGKKVAGLAFQKNNSMSLCHACILVSCELNQLSKYLTPNKIKLLSHHTTSMDKRVVNLNYYDSTKTVYDLENEIEKQFNNYVSGYVETLFVSEKSLLENNEIYKISKEIKDYSEKAKEEEIPNYKIRAADKFDWGFCEIFASINENYIINDIVISTDSIDIEFVDNAKKILIGKNIYYLADSCLPTNDDKINDIVRRLSMGFLKG